ADAPSCLQAFGDHVGPVYVGAARIRFQDRVEDAQRRRLAGAVRSQHASDAAVRRLETDTVNRFDFAEGLFQVADPDHGEGPLYSRKNGIANWRSARHSSSRPSTLAVSTNCAMISGMQVLPAWPCPWSAPTR